MRSPRLGALMSRPATLLAVALDVRLRPRLASLCCCGGGGRPGSPSGRRLADAQQHARGGLEIGQLAVTVARSVSRRASRSPTFVFSTLIWSNILGVVGMVAFSGFRSI